MKNFKKYTTEGLNFFFKEELNPITGKMDFHIWLRHCVEPETAIEVFFNIDKKRYNSKYKRWEAYSEYHDLYIYYFFYKNNFKNIIIISAFSE